MRRNEKPIVEHWERGAKKKIRYLLSIFKKNWIYWKIKYINTIYYVYIITSCRTYRYLELFTIPFMYSLYKWI